MRRSESVSLLAILVFLFFFQLYLQTSCPTIFVGDDGDMITAAYLTGIPHPTGYPSYVMIAKCAQLLLPFGNVASRTNILSVIFSALTPAVLFATLYSCVGILPALSVSFILGLSSSLWYQSGVSRVYSLNIFFIVLFVFLSFRIGRTRSFRLVMTASLLSGIAAGIHLISLLGMLIWAPFAFQTIKKRFFVGMSLSAISFILGFSIFIYMPVRSAQNPAVDWENTETVEGFVDAMSRKAFWSRSEIRTRQDLFKAVGRLTMSLSEEFGGTASGILLGSAAFAGVIISIRMNVQLLYIVCVLCLGNILLLFSHGSYYDLYLTRRYFMLFYTGVVISSSISFYFLLNLLRKKFQKKTGPLLLAFVLLFYFIYKVTDSYAHQDKSRNFIAFDYGSNLLKTVSHNGILMTLRDNQIFTTLYLQYVERRRPDIELVHRGGDILPQSLIFAGVPEKGSKRNRLEYQLIRRSRNDVYFSEYRSPEGLPGYTIQPYGVLFRIIRGTERFKIWDNWGHYVFRGIYNPLLRDDYLMGRILDYYLQATKSHSEIINLNRQIEKLQKETEASDMSPRARAMKLNELGILYAKNNMLNPAKKAFEKAVQEAPELKRSHLNLIQLFKRTRKYHELAEQYQILIKHHPEEWTFRYEWAELLDVVFNNRKKAKRLLEEIADSAPAWEPAKYDAMKKLQEFSSETKNNRDNGS